MIKATALPGLPSHDTDMLTITDVQHDVFAAPIDPNIGLYLEGTSSNDTIWGTNGDDGIYGLAGNDILHGAAGNDTIDGGAGNDVLDGGLGADHLIGGAGIDTATYANASSAVWADLSYGGLGGEAAGDTYSGIENLTGSSHDDTLFGDAGNNVIDGGAGADWIVAGAGNDTLLGGSGDDHLNGGDGNDVLNGGSGNNVLTGGAGADVFTFTKNDGSANNVQDFEFNIDKVALHGFTPADLGTDGELAHGSISYLHGYQVVLPDGAFNQSDSLFFREDTHQLIQLDHSQTNPAMSVLDGTVIATFANDATIHTYDLMFA